MWKDLPDTDSDAAIRYEQVDNVLDYPGLENNPVAKAIPHLHWAL